MTRDMPGEIYAVASGKGGVGKTTTTAYLGLLVHEAGHDVVVVDADLEMANLAVMLGVTVTGPTIHDVLSGNATVDEAITQGPTGLPLVPGDADLDGYADVKPEGIGKLLHELSEQYDYVFVDTGAGITHEGAIPLGIATAVILVTSPLPVAVDDTAKTAELTERLQGTVGGVVVTMAGDYGLSTEEINARIGYNVIASVPNDPSIVDALGEEQPLSVATGPAMEAYRTLLSRMDAKAPAKAPVEEVVTPKPADAMETDGSTDETQVADEATSVQEAGDERGEEKPADHTEPDESADEPEEPIPVAEPETDPEAPKEQKAASVSEVDGIDEAESTDEAPEEVDTDPVEEEATKEEDDEKQKPKGFFARLAGLFG